MSRGEARGPVVMNRRDARHLSGIAKVRAVRTGASASLSSVRNGGEGRGEEAHRNVETVGKGGAPLSPVVPHGARETEAPLMSTVLHMLSRQLILLLIVVCLLCSEWSAALGASPTNAELPAVVTYPVKGVQHIKRKLGQIVLPEVHFDGVPLAEVVKRLSAEAKRFDPERRGVNFVIFDPPQAPVPPVVGGNPAPVGAPLSLGDGLIHVRQPLTGLTLREALDVICKSAEVPTQFGVEDYAVSFFLRVPGGVFGRTIRANPDTFRQGLPGVVMSMISGVTVGANSPGGVAQGQEPTVGPGRALIPATAAATPGSAGDGNRMVRQFVGAAGMTSVGVTATGGAAVPAAGNGAGPVRRPMNGPRLTAY